MGKLTIKGVGMGAYTITPSSKVYQEYVNIDTANYNEWYGDAGGGPPSTVSSTFTFDPGGSFDKQDGIARGVTVRGLIYSKYQFTTLDENVFHGIILNEKETVEIAGSAYVFYDPTAADDVRISNLRLRPRHWREEPGTWPL